MRGLRRGLVRELIGLIAFAVGLALAFRYDVAVGAVLHRHGGSLSPSGARIVASERTASRVWHVVQEMENIAFSTVPSAKDLCPIKLGLMRS